MTYDCKYNELSDFSYLCKRYNNNNAMKYIVRTVKYFIYFSVMCSLIIAVLVTIGAVEGDINSIFEEGYRSVGKIAIFFALIAAVYPKLGFITRNMSVNGSWNDIRTKTLEFMNERRYSLESESEGRVTFRFKSTTGRISKMLEDRITLTSSADGWQMEGLRKDVLRLSSGLENILTPHEAE